MGFAQEMKDFLSAYQAGVKINAAGTDREYKAAMTDAQKKKTERDNDPETLALQEKQSRANLDKTRAGIGAIGASTALSNERLKSVRQARDFAVQDRATAANAGNPFGIDVPGADQIPQSAIPAYEDGGMVEDDNEEFGGDEDGGEEAMPAPPPYRSAIPTDVSAQARQPVAATAPQGLNGVVAPQAVFDATRAGLGYGMRAAGLDRRGIRSRASQLQAQQLAQGFGGMTQKEMDSVRKAVDPNGKMTESQRNMAALGAVYQFNASKGNMGGAEKIAFGMLQHFRVASQRYAAISAMAAKEGNLDLAASAAVKAYANVPDGRDLKIAKGPDGKLQYSVTDENGKQLMGGIATPQELAAQAMGMAAGGFDKAILTAAGQRAAKDPNASKQTTFNTQPLDKRMTGLDAHIKQLDDAFKDKLPEEEKEKKFRMEPELAGDIKDAAAHILQDNPKTQPREAYRTAMQLYSPEAKFKVEDSTEDGMHTLKVGNQRIKVTDSQLDTIMERQAENLAKQAKEREGTTVEKPAKGYGEMALDVGRAALALDDRVGRGVGEDIANLKSGAAAVGGALGDAARYVGRSLVDEETAARVGSAANRVSAIPSDIAENLQGKYDRLRNRGDVPPIDAPM